LDVICTDILFLAEHRVGRLKGSKIVGNCWM